jgi:hypothetical protein
MIRKRFCFDLDATLVTDSHGKYDNCKPIPEAVAKVQRLYQEGHWIIILTARGTTSKKDYREFTRNQLDEFAIPYHELVVGLKPSADYFIDDKAVNAHDWLEDEEAALAKVTTQDHVKKWIPMDPYFPYAKKVIEDLERENYDLSVLNSALSDDADRDRTDV